MRIVSPIIVAAAAAVLLLGAGCTKQPAAAPTPTSPPEPAAVAPVEELNPILVAPAPTAPPPPDVPSVPNTPPSVRDVVAPTPQPATPPPTSVSPSPPAPPPPTPEPAVATPPTPSVRVVTITAKQWEFIPAEIRIRKNEPVVLEVTSIDVTHGLSIPDFNINRNLQPGTTDRIEFTPNKTGRFGMVCSVFCGQGHRDMRGTLIVE